MPKEPSPSQKRENTLGSIIQHLGATQTSGERYNNGYAHHSLAYVSSFCRAFESRMNQLITNINVQVLEAIPVDPEDEESVKKSLILKGKSIIVERPIFENTMTITKWIENFYQESPSINARAREDQRVIGENAFKVPAIVGFQPFGNKERSIEAD